MGAGWGESTPFQTVKWFFSYSNQKTQNPSYRHIFLTRKPMTLTLEDLQDIIFCFGLYNNFPKK